MIIRKSTLDDLNGFEYDKWMGDIKPEDFMSLNPYTYIEDGKVMAIGGVVKLRKHVGEAFVLASKNIKNKLSFVKALRYGLWKEMEALDLFRIEGHTICSVAQGAKLLEYLGFKLECVAESYDGFNDFKQYALVIK